MDIQEQIERLTMRLGQLANQQRDLSKQILALTDELEQLQRQATAIQSTQKSTPQSRPPVASAETKANTTQTAPASGSVQPINPTSNNPTSNIPTSTPPAVAEGMPQAKPTSNLQPPTFNQPAVGLPRGAAKKTTLEEFIGGNLTSKAGILITIIGIFIGAKYAIEHNLVNPVVRVISGYIAGLVLIGVAIRLRKKYEQYSSVLMGGGLAVLYFITYIAYSFYALMPQVTAFGLMLLFTAGTVYAALLYNRIIIAHLGLVGAYAIPILLSDNSGRFAVLFTYISIINAGILVLSFRKYWKSLFYVSFILTWLIYSSWFTFQYREADHFNIAFIFLSIFFVIFYTTFLAYKLIKKEQYAISDVVLLLSNAFLFYGFGYGILDSRPDTAHLPGAFTLANAAVHFVISLVIRKLQLADKALFYLVLGLVIAFITIAVPVQLDGNWVTLLWTMEAVLVFFIGRTQQRTSYEQLGALLSVLSFFSLLHDWANHIGRWTNDDASRTPFMNIVFVTGLLVSAAQGAILYLHRRKSLTAGNAKPWHVFYDMVLPLLFLLTTYFVFQLETAAWFERIRARTAGNFAGEISGIEFCTTLLYTMAFVGLVTYINERRVKTTGLSIVAMLLIVACMGVLLLHGLNEGNKLSTYYLNQPQTYFGIWNLLVRYLLAGAAAVLLVLGYRTLKNLLQDRTLMLMFSVFVQVVILAIASFEYLLWAELNEAGNEYKLGLSILWSIYALGLVILGINKKKKHWRLTGIFFFIVTLLKLFLYDLNQTTTISKTISFISLGAILLLVSYLYNRYKEVILADDEEQVKSEK
jgi:uncharacterized membrane protein